MYFQSACVFSFMMICLCFDIYAIKATDEVGTKDLLTLFRRTSHSEIMNKDVLVKPVKNNMFKIQSRKIRLKRSSRWHCYIFGCDSSTDETTTSRTPLTVATSTQSTPRPTPDPTLLLTSEKLRSDPVNATASHLFQNNKIHTEAEKSKDKLSSLNKPTHPISTTESISSTDSVFPTQSSSPTHSNSSTTISTSSLHHTNTHTHNISVFEYQRSTPARADLSDLSFVKSREESNDKSHHKSHKRLNRISHKKSHHGHHKKSHDHSPDKQPGVTLCEGCQREAAMVKKKQMTEDEVKDMRLAMFKTELLKRLRVNGSAEPGLFEFRGSPRRPVRLPDEMLADVEVTDNAEVDTDYYAQDQQVYIPGRMMGECISHRATGCYEFPLKNNIRKSVAKAELWVYKNKDRNDIHGQTIIVSELEWNNRMILKKKNKLIQRENIFLQEDWVKLDLTLRVTRWAREKQKRTLLAIRCKNCVTRSPRALFGAKHGYKPLLIITFDNSQDRNRGKRSASRCNPRYSCCKRPLVVNLREIPEIRATLRSPDRLTVDYCYGHCDSLSNTEYAHTEFKNRHLNHINNSLINELKPCCVPVVLRPVELLNNGEDDVVFSQRIEHVRVGRCGCL